MSVCEACGQQPGVIYRGRRVTLMELMQAFEAVIAEDNRRLIRPNPELHATL